MSNSMTYRIYTVMEVDNLRDEQMGSKPKFWFLDPESQNLWLFKYARQHTGEDWAEKIASELAALLGLPRARVELATCTQKRGTISLDFTDKKRKGYLSHGNELLFEIDDTYPQHQQYRVSQHTVANITQILSLDFVAPSVVEFFPNSACDAKGVFLGYLLLDALIGNTDRHHENWGLLVRSEGGKRIAELAPTFDHASSLGRELTDERISTYLSCSKDRNVPNVEKYADKGASAVYLRAGGKPLTPLEAFRAFSSHTGNAKAVWLDKLAQISDDIMQDVVERVPTSILGSDRRKFIGRFLRYNRRRLLDTGMYS